MKQIKNNENHEIIVKGSIDSIEIMVLQQHATNNTSIVATDIELNNIRMEITDLDTGEKIYNEEVRKLCMALQPNSIAAAQCISELGTITHTKGASDVEIRMLDLTIPVQLTGNYRIYFTNGTVFNTNLVASSYVAVGVNATTEVFQHAPHYEIIDIKAGSSSFNESLGHGIKYLAFGAFTAIDADVDNYPLVSASVSSTLETIERTIEQVQAYSRKFAPSVTSASGCNFILHTGEILMNCSVSGGLNSSLVTGGNQFLLIERVSINADKINEGKRRKDAVLNAEVKLLGRTPNRRGLSPKHW